MSDDGECAGFPLDELTDGQATRFVLPTGTVTLLLTDVEGSTHRWDTAREAMTSAISRHYAILDAVVAAHAGVRPLEQGEGDSIVAAFSLPSDALAAAVDAQRMLAIEPWQDGADLAVRIAIHTGEAQLRDEKNYFGQTVIRCARLRAIGHGGQILVSDATASLLADHLPPGTDLVDLGVHRLKNLVRPERVWQVCTRGLPQEFPPLLSVGAFRHHLPVQLSPLIGRESEIADVIRRVRSERLVTLTGAGGVGKTRLALAVGAELEKQYAGGLCFVELAALRDPAAIPSAVLAALGAFQSGADLTGQLIGELGNLPTVLVLDNCEHLIDACARLVTRVLTAKANVTVLATSREPLHATGEVIWDVPSLGMPPRDQPVSAAELSQYDAVQLFIDRALRARPSFAISDVNACVIAEVCRRLDGIPLALELAASRCRYWPVEQIATELDDRFRLLTGGPSTADPRQQTMIASIDWSYERLETAEQKAFQRVSVFAGPFSLEAAEDVVAAAGGISKTEVFDLLTRLVDKSLLNTDESEHGESRFLVLETLREYGLRRLRDVGELEETCRAHLDWCCEFLDRHAAILHCDTTLELVEALHETLRTALDFGVEYPDRGLRLLRHLGRAWQVSGRPADALRAIAELLTEDNASRYGREWVAAANAIGPLLNLVGFGTSDKLFRDAETLAFELELPYQAAVARWFRNPTAENCAAARDLSEIENDTYLATMAHIGWIDEMICGTPATAVELLDAHDVVTACRDSGALRDYADVTRALAYASVGRLRQCIEICIELATHGSPFTLVGALNRLSLTALLTRDSEVLDRAAAIAQQRMTDAGPLSEIAHAVLHRRELLEGKPSHLDVNLRDHIDHLGTYTVHLLAREAIDAGESLVALHAVDHQGNTGAYADAVAAAVRAVASNSEDEWHTALRLAADHELRPIAVDALEGLAAAASVGESWSECLRLAGAAQSLREDCDYLWRFPTEQRALDKALASARNALGDRAADAEREGRDIAWTDAAEYANRARGQRKRPQHGWASVTPKEERVVILVAQGLTNPQIAQRLFITPSTVKTHLEHVFVKLNVTSRAELAALAARRGE